MATTPQPAADAADAAVEPPTTLQDIIRVIGVTAVSNQTFAQTIHRSIESLQTEVGAIVAQARNTTRNVDALVDGSDRQQLRAFNDAVTSMAATAAQNKQSDAVEGSFACSNL